MLKPEIVEDIANKINDLIPESLKQAQKDIRKNIRAVLQSALGKLDVVTRDEFDAQVALLEKAQKQLNELEKIVTELEKK